MEANHYKRFLTFPGGLLHIEMHKQDLDDNCIEVCVLVHPDYWRLSDVVPPERPPCWKEVERQDMATVQDEDFPKVSDAQQGIATRHFRGGGC